MKTIKICPANSTAIQMALSPMNGKSTTRGFTTYADIQKLAISGEMLLEQLDLPPRDRADATYVANSGKPNTYEIAGTYTRVTLRRRSVDWYLEGVQQRVIVQPEHRGSACLTLTPGQDARMCEVLRRRYSVRAASVMHAPAVKSTRVVAENRSTIFEALAGVNGRATSHAYCTYDDIENLAEAAEKALVGLGMSRRDRAGAVYVSTSGSPVANAYKYRRTATRVTLLRRPGGWYLEHIEGALIYAQGGGRATLTLTPEQDARVVEVRRERYVVRCPEQLAAEAAREEAVAVLQESSFVEDHVELRLM